MCRSTQQTKEGLKDKHKMMFGFEGGEKLLEVSRKTKHPPRGRGGKNLQWEEEDQEEGRSGGGSEIEKLRKKINTGINKKKLSHGDDVG